MLSAARLAQLCDARDLLQDVQHTGMSVADICAAISMSRFHFIRQFRALFGETPQQYRTRARLAHAKHLLANSQSTVTDICMAVGFSSLGSFSALFARHFGEAPSVYRRRHAESREPVAPGCMALLRASWERDSQFSRSQRSPDSGKLPTGEQLRAGL